MRVPPGTPGARICVVCGDPFKAAHIATKTCSQDCGYELRRRMAKADAAERAKTRGALGAPGVGPGGVPNVAAGLNPVPATFPGSAAADWASRGIPHGVSVPSALSPLQGAHRWPEGIVSVTTDKLPGDPTQRYRGHYKDGSSVWLLPSDSGFELAPVTFNLVPREPGAGPSHEHGAASALANAFGLTAVLDPIVNAGKGVELPASLIEPKGGYAVPAKVPKAQHPRGWEPHVEEEGDRATGVTAPTENANADEEWVIRSFGFDPVDWRIAGDINCRRWQAVVPVRGEDGAVTGHEQRWLYYYRASLVRRTSKLAVDVQALADEMRNWTPVKREIPEQGSVAFVVCIADLQLGKGDQDGATGTIRRFMERIDSVVQRASDLRTLGVPIGPLYVFGLGDILESCGTQFYAMGLYSAQLNMRDQRKVAFRMIVSALKTWAPLFSQVVVAAIPGNHGEASRSGGKATSDFGDNWDLSVFEDAETVLLENDAFSHVSFVIPKDELTVTLDVCGAIVGLAHGHQFRKGNIATKAIEWWKGQSHGGQPIGSAQILLSGHYHHLRVAQDGHKTHIQAPALEGGSDWWRHITGQESAKGILTLVVGSSVGPVITPELRAGWDHMAVL